MKTKLEILEELRKPFMQDELDFRIGQSGKTSNGKVYASCFTYITGRAVMNRLDEVFGIDGWKDEYRENGDGFICKLSVKIDGEWITKEDGADKTKVEALKGGLSDALKRAAVKFGIGRYLYSLESSYVRIVEKNTPNAKYGKLKDNTVFYWLPPVLPEWALPKNEKKEVVLTTENFAEEVENLSSKLEIKKPSEKQLEILRENKSKLEKEEIKRLKNKEVSSLEASKMISRILG